MCEIVPMIVQKFFCGFKSKTKFSLFQFAKPI